METAVVNIYLLLVVSILIPLLDWSPEVELEDGSCKQVKRLALRFNAEDPEVFAQRVETCRAKKAHCELQQAFINYIDSQPLSM
ncbi:unnamed protein product, partial [Polarella glacialis]